VRGSIAELTGAGNHKSLCDFASRLHGSQLEDVATLPVHDRAAFAKALAVYEDSVGGLGSTTALQHVLRLFEDDHHEGFRVVDWIYSHTKRCDYYNLYDFIDEAAARRRHAEAQAENERKNYELAAPARARRAESATSNLFNAVRRGDVKAVRALLQKGASPSATTPDGKSLAEYAEANGRADIAELLREPKAFSDATEP
jgi:hypothetical protein